MTTYNANASVHPMTAAQEKACLPDCGYGSTGLTKRELIAAMAMQGLLASGRSFVADVSNYAVANADALLAELAKEPQA